MAMESTSRTGRSGKCDGHTYRVKYGLSDVAIIGHAPVDNMQSDTFI